MAQHPYHMHREHQVGHRRVNHVLKEEPAGAKQHSHSAAFSKVTSKSAAEGHDMKVSGGRSAKRFARGGKVKTGNTNIAIVLPGGSKQGQTPMPMPMPGPAAAPPAPGPGAPPPGLPPGGPPPGMMPRARGGRAMNIDGEATPANIKKMGARAAANSYFRGGAASGVGREEKAAHMKRKGR